MGIEESHMAEHLINILQHFNSIQSTNVHWGPPTYPQWTHRKENVRVSTKAIKTNTLSIS